jgi:hypothetical protein
VRGAVAVLGLGDRRVNGIEVALVTIEAPLVESAAGTTDVHRSAEPIDVGQPGEGDALSFELQVPRDSCTSFESAFRRVTHAVEVKVELGTLWKTSRAVRLPIVTDEVIDVFAAAGLKKPDISILSEEFLA